jgi:NADPH:quinone reductase-like Zn-dependent oxidoreductase
MQAVRVHDGGELRFEAAPDPVAATDEVIVELRCAGVNRRDVLVRSGVYPFPLPLIPGSDGAGVRRDTGEEVVILPSLHWGAGEEVPGPSFEILGGPSDGTYAELVAVPRDSVHPKPAGLSWQQAAAFPLAGVTAWRALFARGGLRAGETAVILGAGSGVSTFAIQLAVQAGARVLVTSSSAESVERAQALGAEAGVLYTEPGWADAVRELAPAGGVDLVLDSVGSTWDESLAIVRPGGRVVVLGATGGETVELRIRPFYLGQRSLLGSTMGSPRDFAALLRTLEQGSWVPAIDSVMPLADAERAHTRLTHGSHFGKVVLDCV